jgi:hypothetical protein
MKSAVLSNLSYLTLKTNSKILYPSALLGIVAPTALVDYQFRLQGTLTNYGSVGGSLTLTRSGNGTFIGSNGLLQTAGTNVARFDFDPVSLTRRGLLFEGQATNLVRDSENFTGLGWSFGGSALSAPPTRTTYTGQLPDGSSGTIYRYAFTSVTAVNNFSIAFNFFTILQSSVTIAAPSIWIKRVSGATTINLYAESSSTAPPTGAWASEEFTLTSEWRRYGFAKAIAGTKAGNLSFLIGNDSRPAGGTFSAVTVDVFGAQLQLDRVDSYIPTAGAAATRFADAASMTDLPTTNVTLIEKPAGCATLSAGTLTLNTGYTIDRIMVLPGTYSADQVTTIRGLM